MDRAEAAEYVKKIPAISSESLRGSPGFKVHAGFFFFWGAWETFFGNGTRISYTVEKGSLL